MQARRVDGLSVAEGFVGFEAAVSPVARAGGQLRLLAPWRKDEWDHPDEIKAVLVDDTAPAAPAFDRRSATTALLNVLREWRIVAREMERIDPGSGERTLLEAEDSVLRALHHRLFGELRRG